MNSFQARILGTIHLRNQCIQFRVSPPKRRQKHAFQRSYSNIGTAKNLFLQPASRQVLPKLPPVCHILPTLGISHCHGCRGRGADIPTGFNFQIEGYEEFQISNN